MKKFLLEGDAIGGTEPFTHRLPF